MESFHAGSDRDTFNLIVSAQGLFEFTLSRLLTSKTLEGGFLLLWGTSTLALTIFRIDEPRIGRGWFQDGDLRFRSVWGRQAIAQHNVSHGTVVEWSNRHRTLGLAPKVWGF